MAYRTNEPSTCESPATEKWYVKLTRFMLWIVWSVVKCVLLIIVAPFMLALYIVLSIPIGIHDAWEQHEKRRSERLGARR